jgi:hypothetical protein
VWSIITSSGVARRACKEITAAFGRLRRPLAALRSLRRTYGYASVARLASDLLARPRCDALISLQALWAVLSMCRGRSMFEKMCWLRDQGDSLRKRMLREPRGYPAANCNIVLPSSQPEATPDLSSWNRLNTRACRAPIRFV